MTTEEADFLEKIISKTQDTPKIKELMPIYTGEQLQQETGYQSEFLERLERTLKRKKQIVLTGCPGSGKTYLADKLAQYLTSESDGFIELIQFHPAYTYEDFMQGLRPLADNENNLTYQIVAGRFLEFCEQASRLRREFTYHLSLPQGFALISPFKGFSHSAIKVINEVKDASFELFFAHETASSE